MVLIVREGRPEDLPFISEWTKETFAWGDYVAEVFLEWVADDAGTVIVGELDGLPIAMGRVAMVAPTEAWAQAMRVHPNHRRAGHGTAVSHAMWAWARQRGALIVRLAIDHRNEASAAQVATMGFRKMSDWRRGERAIGENSPVPEGNGGARIPPMERLDDAPSAEAEPAFLSWSTGELARVARGLLPISWVWRTMNLDHLVLAARNHNLLEGRPGWAITELDEDGVFQVHWMETSPDDAHAMVLALVDRAVEGGVSMMKVMIPDVPWLAEPFTQSGFEFMDVGVWALGL
jgi:GNAT superfamily N-acetyltransferase